MVLAIISSSMDILTQVSKRHLQIPFDTIVFLLDIYLIQIYSFICEMTEVPGYHDSFICVIKDLNFHQERTG